MSENHTETRAEPKRPAVFLDRDGVLNKHLPDNYVKKVEELVVFPEAGRAIAQLDELRLPVFLISNQQGVGRGKMTHEDLYVVHKALCEELGKSGGEITQEYYCTELESANSERRKPRPGMILEAAREHNIDLARSFFVGDTHTDAQAAYAGGVGHFILVLSGRYIQETEKAFNDIANSDYFPVRPDYVAADLMEAVGWIKENAVKP